MPRRVLLIGPLLLLLAACAASSETPRERTPEQELYLQTEQELVNAVMADGAEGSIELLKRRMDENAGLSSQCHPLAHAIGRAAYERYGFAGALEFRDDVCGTGYLHGVVEVHFLGLPDPEAAAATLCPPDAADCFHGMGHGLMLARGNDVDRSIATCKGRDRNFQRIQCAEGVFMELFQVEDESHEPIAFGGDSLTPCRPREEPYKAICAFYAPRHHLRLHPDDEAGVIDLCRSIDRPTRDACVKGVGSVMMKTHIEDPKAVEAFCLSMNDEERTYCLEGMASYFIVHYASAPRGKAMCETLGEEARGPCLRIVQESMRFYPE